MSKRVFVTLSDADGNDLERWAESRGEKPGSLAGFLLQKALFDARSADLIPAENTSTKGKNKKWPTA